MYRIKHDALIGNNHNSVVWCGHHYFYYNPITVCLKVLHFDCTWAIFFFIFNVSMNDIYIFSSIKVHLPLWNICETGSCHLSDYCSYKGLDLIHPNDLWLFCANSFFCTLQSGDSFSNMKIFKDNTWFNAYIYEDHNLLLNSLSTLTIIHLRHSSTELHNIRDASPFPALNGTEVNTNGIYCKLGCVSGISSVSISHSGTFKWWNTTEMLALIWTLPGSTVSHWLNIHSEDESIQFFLYPLTAEA